jgi:hypothetical protein
LLVKIPKFLLQNHVPRNPKFVLINKQGELLQQETDALRAQLSPSVNQAEETEVPISQNDDESTRNFEAKAENERLIQLIPKKFKENLTYKYRDMKTNERMKSIRAKKRKKYHHIENRSERDIGEIEHMEEYGNPSFFITTYPRFVISKTEFHDV